MRTQLGMSGANVLRRERFPALGIVNHGLQRVLAPWVAGILCATIRSPEPDRLSFRKGAHSLTSRGIWLSVRSIKTGVLVLTQTSASLKNFAGTFSSASPTVLTGIN